MRQSITETLRSFFGETGVATIGQMEANLSELAKLVDDFVLDNWLSPVKPGAKEAGDSHLVELGPVSVGLTHQVKRSVEE